MKINNSDDKIDLPYRLGVGLMLVNKDNKVLIAQRIDTKINGWQMPQGGIDTGETPSKAVLREMGEEIGTNKGIIIAEAKSWYFYDIPKFMIPKLWGGKYKGQKQKWFLIRFTGQDSEINVDTENQEFKEWKWSSIEEMMKVIVPFKTTLYKAVIKEFEKYLKS
jgi:putative (di)nucleoside polyphosphate hydrolase